MMAQLNDFSLVYHYQWEPTDVKKETNTLLSKMIQFRKQKSFRVGLKKASHSTNLSDCSLIFMTTNLPRMGMKAADVAFSGFPASNYEENEYHPMTKESNEDDKTNSFQLFSHPMSSLLPAGDRTLNFRIYIAGVVEDYQVQRMDLLMDELWRFANDKSATDFEFITLEGRRFPVHKFILAARSPVFASLCDTSEDETQFQQKTESVDATCMEQFLKFIYTGQLEGVVNNHQLKQLAETYQVKSLQNLCRFACHDGVGGDEMASWILHLKKVRLENKQNEGKDLVEISPDIDSKVDVSSTAVGFCFTWELELKENKSVNIWRSEAFEFEGEKAFRAQVTTTRKKEADSDRISYDFQVIFVSFAHDKIGCKIDEVSYSVDGYSFEPRRMKKECTKDGELLLQFTRTDSVRGLPGSITFHVLLASTIPHFNYQLVDSTWKKEIWASTANKKFTNVEFLLGEESFFAHQSVLFARSEFFAKMFARTLDEAQMVIVPMEDADPATFRHFLMFVYTGSLAPSSNKEKLGALADKYEVKTLADLCKSTKQLIEIEDVTDTILSYY